MFGIILKKRVRAIEDVQHVSVQTNQSTDMGSLGKHAQFLDVSMFFFFEKRLYF